MTDSPPQESERKLVMITWHDAMSDHAGWKKIDKVSKQQPPVARTVGWVIKRTRRAVTLVSSIVDDECDGDVVIPTGMIIREQELEIKK